MGLGQAAQERRPTRPGDRFHRQAAASASEVGTRRPAARPPDLQQNPSRNLDTALGPVTDLPLVV